MQLQRKAEGLPHVPKQMHCQHAIGEQNIGRYIQMAVLSVVIILIAKYFPFTVPSVCVCVGTTAGKCLWIGVEIVWKKTVKISLILQSSNSLVLLSKHQNFLPQIIIYADILIVWNDISEYDRSHFEVVGLYLNYFKVQLSFNMSSIHL